MRPRRFNRTRNRVLPRWGLKRTKRRKPKSAISGKCSPHQPQPARLRLRAHPIQSPSMAAPMPRFVPRPWRRSRSPVSSCRPALSSTPATAPLAVKEDLLREEARTLVEKCAEFDVRGQVVQINPGPMVTTYEFKPEAGVKYSRVTGLADDLCLAMRAESILIERMAGKSTVGIQVPESRARDHSSARCARVASRSRRAKSQAHASPWAKTSTAASSPPISPPCRTCSSPVPPARANRWPSTP